MKASIPAPKPFDCTYAPQFAALLHKLGISLIISTYQAGKVIVLSCISEDRLIQLPRTFDYPMGMATSENKLAIATKNEVITLHNSTELAQCYPAKPDVYDELYLPRVKHYTGYLAMHDMAYDLNNKLVSVNTLFSCLCHLNDEYSFTPIWQPPFISELAPEDRCHLNGMAMENGLIKYVTAMSQSNGMEGWRHDKMNSGIVMEYPSGKIIKDGLTMPHSPRVYDGKLYVLNSAQGELICIDPDTGDHKIMCQLGGFARGMCRYGDYLFIGVSKLRHHSPVFKDLPITKTSFSGAIAVYLPYGNVVGNFEYQMTVDEIYDIKVLPARRVSILSPDMEIHHQALSLPELTFWGEHERNKIDSQ